MVNGAKSTFYEYMLLRGWKRLTFHTKSESLGLDCQYFKAVIDTVDKAPIADSSEMEAVVWLTRGKHFGRSYKRLEILSAVYFNQKKWRKICEEAGVADLRFHDLRKTFGSMLAQNGISTAVTQRLLEHSSPNLTNKVYTNIDPVLRQSVERLPIQKWL